MANIDVRGARVHNLKDVSISLPQGKLIVFTGPSGSGKSSLAFDTLFAEGQRRYVESMSVYARQYLTRLQKPDVDEIRGLAPTISIEQKATSNNPRSTVGTITEVHDHLRVLWAQLGVQHCSGCGEVIGAADAATIVRAIVAMEPGTRLQLLAPLVRNRKGEFRDVFERLRQQGFVRARIDGSIVMLEAVDRLHRDTRHTIEVVVDRIAIKDGAAERVHEAVKRALELGEGQLVVVVDSGAAAGTERYFSDRSHCAACDLSFPPLTHQSFSFNSPVGRCPECHGLGTERRMSETRVVRDPALSVKEGCFTPLANPVTRDDKLFVKLLLAFCAHHGVSTREPWERLPREHRELLLDGVEQPESIAIPGRKNPLRFAFEGVLPYLLQQYDSADTEAKQQYFQQFLSPAPCSACGGSRLRPESAAVRLRDASLADVGRWDIAEAHRFFASLELEGREASVGDELRMEIVRRLGFLVDVGLGYLALERPGPTLSGGEAQRIRLASQLGSELAGVLYVLDEPSIGLHQRDNRRLIETLARLRDAGNHVIVVEHDRETMEAADLIVDFGPGAGRMGGEICFSGTPVQLRDEANSVTGDYLAGRRAVQIPATRRAGSGHAVVVRGARENNLKDIDVRFPLGTFTCVTGVSGAGKSTLVNEILHPALHNHCYRTEHPVGVCRGVDGLEHLDKVIRIDQSPIGRTPRSNPATYTKVFDEIRKLFAELPEARVYGYKPGRFSFNVGGGRCERCSGLGVERIEMKFLADVEVRCPACRGSRFNEATLRVRLDGRSIADVLAMPIEDAVVLFHAYPSIRRVLQTLVDVGLGYIALGQSSTTLSGGEAQRIKLSRELSRVATGDTLYILDEPSTGLHFDDISKLLGVVQRLVDAGNTVVMIEHNIDIIATADHVIDIGPDGGAAGGELIAEGTPEQVARFDRSVTGPYLRELLDNTPAAPPTSR